MRLVSAALETRHDAAGAARFAAPRGRSSLGCKLLGFVATGPKSGKLAAG